jgi:hypothetical protein
MKMQKQDKVLAETFNRNFLRLLAPIMESAGLALPDSAPRSE